MVTVFTLLSLFVLCCYNRVPKTGSFIKNIILFLIVMEAESQLLDQCITFRSDKGLLVASSHGRRWKGKLSKH